MPRIALDHEATWAENKDVAPIRFKGPTDCTGEATDVSGLTGV